MSMPLVPPGFKTALAVTANVSDKTVLPPSVKQISADFMNTAAQIQTAVRIKSNRVIAIEKKQRGDVGNVVTTLEFGDDEIDSEEEILGFGTKLRDGLKARRARPSALPNAEKLIDDFIRKGSSNIVASILKEDRRKRTPFERKLFKALKVINDNPDWTVAQSDKTNRWIPLEVDYYRKIMVETLAKDCVEVNVMYFGRVEEEAMDIFHTYKPFVDKEEQGYVKSWIKLRDVPTLQLRVKDHKDQRKDGF